MNNNKIFPNFLLIPPQHYNVIVLVSFLAIKTVNDCDRNLRKIDSIITTWLTLSASFLVNFKYCRLNKLQDIIK
jgi:hypothetical protein